MSRLTEEMVIARAKQSDLGLIKKLNCWGSDLSDVSIIKRMRGVEVLALSVNKISTLSPFEECQKLQELYLRKNNISDINEIAYLQNLPALRYLWLEENPCCDQTANYRAVVLRALPNLKKLDNVEVTQEEVDEALRGGGGPVAEDEVYEDAYQQQHQQQTQPQQMPQQQQQHSYPQHSPPTQQQQYHQQQQQQPQQQHQRRSSSPMKEEPVHPPSPMYNNLTKEQRTYHQYDEYYQSDRPAGYPAHYRHSQTDLTEWEEHQQAPQVHHNPYGSQMQLHHQTQRRSEPTYRNGSARENGGEWEPEDRPRSRRPEGRFSDSTNTLSASVVNHYAGFHRRPINRTSNLLSASLCLVKELDYASLEVLEHAVRCRIDELAGE
ncbi:putative transcriptional regulator cudA isoform X6 [Drosophila kikkawai]|uniref:Transcriptional regulator cudA isoform X6 n=1 Tax=Drosophila kikkawai TaxID=30033 RepID=A0ABM4GF93_DROKI